MNKITKLDGNVMNFRPCLFKNACYTKTSTSQDETSWLLDYSTKNQEPTTITNSSCIHLLTVNYKYMMGPLTNTLTCTGRTCHHYFCSQKLFKITEVIPQWSLLLDVEHYLKCFCVAKPHFAAFFTTFQEHMVWQPCWIRCLFSYEKVSYNKEIDILEYKIVLHVYKGKDTSA